MGCFGEEKGLILATGESIEVQVPPQLPNHKVKVKQPGQRACNEKDEKGKFCGGHLKRWFYTADVRERLLQVAEQTGGYAYFEGLTNPVTVAPFLSDLQLRLASQYRITVTGLQGTGLQSINVRSVVPDIKVTAPTRVYLP